MKYSKKMVYSLLGFIVCINILYRYPSFPHESGFDSFYMHNLADSISYFGRAKWVINPLSYLGMYAFSYPSGIPFLFSEVSLVTSVSIEVSILFAGIMFGIVGALFAYLVAKEMLDNDIFAFFTSLAFSISPILLNITTWEGSTKGYVVTLIPMLIFFIVKHLKTGNTKYLILALTTLVTLSAIHRIGYIAVFIFLAYLFTLPIHNITRFAVSPDLAHLKLKRLVVFVSVVGAFGAALALLFFSPGFLGSADINTTYSSTTILHGNSPLITLANVGISYTGKMGIMLPFMFIGIFALAWRERRTPQEKFLILMTIFLIPFLPMREYMTPFMVSIFAIIIGFSIFYLCNLLRKRRKTVIAIVLVIIVSSMGFSWTMRDYWKDKYSYNLMTEQTYNTGIYMKYTLSKNDMFIANKGYVSLRITAVSRIVSLPLGGASGASYNAQQLVYDKNFDLEIATIYSDIKPVKLDELTYATNEIFTFNDPGRIYDGELSWANILDRGCEDFGGKLIQDRFNIHYAVETHDLDGKYVFWVMYTSGFLLSVHELRYKIYDNSEEALWYV